MCKDLIEMLSRRPASINDAKFVNELTRRVMWNYVCETWSENSDIDGYFTDNQFKKDGTEIILFGDKRIGRITIQEDNNSVTVEELHIQPDFQSKGIGRFLLKEIIKNSSNMNKVTRLMVLKSNPAQKLYKDIGFSIYKETPERLYMEACYAET